MRKTCGIVSRVVPQIPADAAMSIDALISGRLVKDPEAKVSAGGKSYALMIVKSGEDFIRCLLFAEDLTPFLKLGRGDPVALVGSLTPSLYERSGVQQIGLSALCSRAISPVAKIARPKTDKAGTQGQFRAAAHAQRSGDGDLPDTLPW